MSDQNDSDEFGIVGNGEPLDDDVVPGRSVFGDDDDSFEDDDAAVPHWSEPATGAVPQVGGASDAVIFAPPDEPVEMSHEEPDDEGHDAPPDEDLGSWSDVAASPRWADEEAPLPPAEPLVDADGPDAADDFFAFDDSSTSRTAEPSLGAKLSATRGSGGESDRDMPIAVMVGVGLAAGILAAMMIGSAAAVAVVTLFLGLAAVEFFNAVRVAGHQPAVLLGLAATVTMPLGVYWRGESAMTVVLVLSVIFGSLWYLTGVGNESPVRGLGTTLLGILHIGLLGSFAALMLSVDVIGTGMLTAAVLITVGYDVGALAVGKAAGRTPLSPASPNKTLEGLVGGMVAAVAIGFAMGAIGQPAPFAGDEWGGGFGASILLGLVGALAAPIGDLAESQIKRDLGIKDMGSILPGHGGLLDRFDGLLFVLPATYYVARLLDVGVPA